MAKKKSLLTAAGRRNNAQAGKEKLVGPGARKAAKVAGAKGGGPHTGPGTGRNRNGGTG